MKGWLLVLAVLFLPAGTGAATPCPGACAGPGIVETADAGDAAPWKRFPEQVSEYVPEIAPPTMGWLVAWAVLAVLALVVGTSMARPRPVHVDPLLGADGTTGASVRRALGANGTASGPGTDAGRVLAYRASPRTVEDAVRLMGVLGFGNAELAREGGNVHVVRVARSGNATTAGAGAGSTCPFEASFIRGAFETALGRDVQVEETRCGRRAKSTCEFRVRQ